MTTGPLVIFDLDGTLAHTGPDLLATLNRTIEPHGLPPLSLDTLNYTLGQGAKAMIATAFATAEIPLSTTLHDQLFAGFLEDYEQNICVETHLFEGVMEAMVELEKEGCTFAVCTNKTERMARLLLEKLEVSNQFKALTGGDTFEFRKPDPRHLEETARLAGSPLANCIMIGDSKADIGAAKSAAIPSIAVTFGYSDIPVEDLGASRIIDHFSKLPDTVSDLLSNGHAT
jgi:phosphoglycolate phosphatase